MHAERSDGMGVAMEQSDYAKSVVYAESILQDNIKSIRDVGIEKDTRAWKALRTLVNWTRIYMLADDLSENVINRALKHTLMFGVSLYRIGRDMTDDRH